MRTKAVKNTGIRAYNGIKEVLSGSLDLILPYRCRICGNVSDTEDRFEDYDRLYQSVFGKLPELHICGRCLSGLCINDEDWRWFLCLSNPVENDPCPGLALYMPFPYRGIVEKAVLQIKFGREKEIARFFGCVLGSSLLSDGIRADLLVPVPLSEERLEERGFNQAAEIAYPAARLNNIAFAEDCLIKTKNTGRQSEIRDAAIRADNVSGAFSVNEKWDVTGLTVAVADDVATTGATLHEAAKALYLAGAKKVLCIAFAGNRKTKNAEPY